MLLKRLVCIKIYLLIFAITSLYIVRRGEGVDICIYSYGILMH